MAVALHRPEHVAVRLAGTLDREHGRRRPMLAAVRAAFSVLFAVGTVVLVLRAGSVAGVTETLVFGLGAIVYVLADFGAELPSLSATPLDASSEIDDVEQHRISLRAAGQ